MKKNNPGKKNEIAVFLSSLFPSVLLLKRNDPLRMAGATAFFTTFALPPIVFIIAQLFGLIFTPKMVGRGLIENISNNLGTDGAEQVRQVIKSIRGFNNSWYVIVLGFIFLLFVSTTLFIVIKNSLSQIWQLKAKERKGFSLSFTTRLKSFAAILLAGILFFANLVFKSAETMGGNYLEDHFTGSSIYFKLIFSEATSIVIVAAWFIILFRFLTRGTPTWKAVIAGGLLTAVLFTIGRFILRSLLINGNIAALYGPSGSFVLVLLFVFYTSFIMYYGACFIAVYSDKKNWTITNTGIAPAAAANHS